MIINKVRINNLGIFSGNHEFNLRPKIESEQFRPIVIFGGMNGSGKTTIFDGIKLCLYGADVFPQIGKEKYEEYLKEKIHFSKDLVLQPNSASIEIDFEHSRFGELDTYQVERMWEYVGRKVFESLIIRKNGEEIDIVENDHWQDFIKELVPIGLSELFFFDGEKIQKMMSDDKNRELKNSIKSLIGLDVLERLQADLKIYRTKNLKQSAHQHFVIELENYEKELTLINAEIRKINDQTAYSENKISKLTSQISIYNNKIAAQGEGYLKKRDLLEQKREDLEKDIEILKDKLRELAAGLLPVSIACSLAKNLKDQVNKENEKMSFDNTSATLTNKREELFEQIDKNEFLDNLDGIDEEIKKRIKNKLKLEIQTLFRLSQNPLKDKPVIYGLSQKQTLKLIDSIEESEILVPKNLKTLTNEYEKKFRELQNTFSNLQRVPEEELIRPMYETLNELNKDLGMLLKEKEHLTDQLRSKTSKQNEVQRKIDKTIGKMEDNKKANEKMLLVKKTENILSDFYKKLAQSKIKHLEEAFTDIFNELHRKEDMIKKIEINTESFEVHLYDRNTSRINKNTLSSGELEIYAMSMVWALAKVSGQKLPFIVDTPLARLDSEHRDNLIELFFPYASHQMVIFSTNTEVDKKYFEKLKPFISKNYYLEYNNQQDKTLAKEGYFWN